LRASGDRAHPSRCNSGFRVRVIALAAGTVVDLAGWDRSLRAAAQFPLAKSRAASTTHGDANTTTPDPGRRPSPARSLSPRPRRGPPPSLTAGGFGCSGFGVRFSRFGTNSCPLSPVPSTLNHPLRGRGNSGILTPLSCIFADAPVLTASAPVRIRFSPVVASAARHERTHR
jgi:hypothetical protein